MNPLGWRRSRTGLLVPIYPVSGGSPAYPQVQTFATYADAGASQTHVIPMPSGVQTGDLLMLLLGFSGTPGITMSGWDSRRTLTSSTNLRINVRTRVSDGTEGADESLTLTTAQRCAAIIFRISGQHTTLGFEVSTGVTGNGSGPNPDVLTPTWGAEETLWFVFEGISNTSATVNTWPTNYTTGQIFKAGGASVSIATARRELSATSDDPSAFALAGSGDYGVCTIAIRPAPSVTMVVPNVLGMGMSVATGGRTAWGLDAGLH